MNRTLVELVEDHCGDAGQVWVSLDSTGQDAFGNDLDPGAAADSGVISSSPTHGVANALAQQLGHPASNGSGSDAAGFEQQDRAGVPWLVEQPKWYDRGLASPRFRCEHSNARPCHRSPDFGDNFFDRQERVAHASTLPGWLAEARK